MRIIGGAAAGTILKVPKGYDVRPTPDLVKQALFNSLGARVAGTRVLELFSGTGALGMECLSRGASHVTSVEKANRHGRLIQENLAASRLPPEHFHLRVQDAFAAIAQLAESSGAQFDLVMADPPFGEKNVGRRSESDSQKLLDDPNLPKLLAAGGWLILGHTKRDTLSLPAHWQDVKVLRHGDSTIRFLKVVQASA